MVAINYSIIALLFGFAIVSAGYFFAKRKWVWFLLMVAYIVRAFLTIWLESGIKYDMVIDSIRYEYRAWLLAQNWMSPDIFVSLSMGSTQEFNYYEVFLSWIFILMGRDPIIASIVNCILGTVTIYIIYRIQKDFFDVRSTVPTVLLLCFYPSFVVWSATNIRDPLYFCISASFIFTFLTIFSRKKNTPTEFRLLGFPLCALFYLLIIGLRSYAGSIFLGSFAVAFLFYFMTMKMKPKLVIPLILGILFFVATATQLFAPDMLASSLRDLEKTRDAFGNLKLLDFVAKSSFALDQTFTDIFDVLLFLPNSLTHYFFGPFPWEIDSTMQQVAFIEALFVYVLTYPTIIGIKRFYEKSRFETVVILVFVTFVVVAQATVISNMGTIFRHRSLSFLFLLMFTGEGLNELGKKYMPAIFAPERRGTSDSRRKSFFGLKPFWV